MSLICRKLLKVGSGVQAYWDVVGGHSLSDYLTGDAAIQQTLDCDLQLILGEWFLDVSRGVPWFPQPNSTVRTIMASFPADLPYAEAIIKATILAVPGVTGLASFDLTFDHVTRAAKCFATAITENGGTFTLTRSFP
jgi:hypothetical protein